MVWLYKGTYACAYELGTGYQTVEFLSYPLKMLRMLKNFKIKPICVFDGLHLQAKAETEQDRAQNKKRNRELAQKNDQAGDTEQARKHYSRSLVLRTKMIELFMDILKELNIEYIVAPYEADAQISYLVRQGVADIAISEDSDLIAYGCPKILLKLTPTGTCDYFSFEGFYARDSKDCSSEVEALRELDNDEFVFACIMAGCEYLQNIERVGLKVALKHFKAQKNFE